uniref:RNase_PH domain-containing protein n=1 Tax=Globodera pallida TaxID=36090 RepID=A0A183C425_GLOPA
MCLFQCNQQRCCLPVNQTGILAGVKIEKEFARNNNLTFMDKGHLTIDDPEAAQQLLQAEKCFEKAARQLRQLRTIIEKRSHEKLEVSLRSGGADTLNDHIYGVLARIGNGCVYNGSAIIIQDALKSSFLSGSIAIHLMCALLAANAPITVDDCNSLVKTLYTRARNISFEFTSEDVLCNLVNGKCNSQPPAVKNEVNCAYCELMHAKAHKVCKILL